MSCKKHLFLHVVLNLTTNLETYCVKQIILSYVQDRKLFEISKLRAFWVATMRNYFAVCACVSGDVD